MRSIVVDTETTGLTGPSMLDVSKQPRMIEFAGIALEDGEIVDDLTFIVNPGIQIDAKITEITGLTNEDLEKEPTFPAFEYPLQNFFTGADIFIAHNAPFDESIINYELVRHNIILDWPTETLCTAQEFSYLFGRAPRMIELYEHFMGRPLDQTHRAMDDVRALVEIVLASGLLK